MALEYSIKKGSDGLEILFTSIHMDGADGKKMFLPGGDSKTTPIFHQSFDEGRHTLKKIRVNLTFIVAANQIAQSSQESATRDNICVMQIDRFIPLQFNIRLFQRIAKMPGVPFERFYITIAHYGNLSSPYCAIALDGAVKDGSNQTKNKIVCLPVFGVRLTCRVHC